MQRKPVKSARTCVRSLPASSLNDIEEILSRVPVLPWCQCPTFAATFRRPSRWPKSIWFPVSCDFCKCCECLCYEEALMPVMHLFHYVEQRPSMQTNHLTISWNRRKRARVVSSIAPERENACHSRFCDEFAMQARPPTIAIRTITLMLLQQQHAYMCSFRWHHRRDKSCSDRAGRVMCL